MARRSGVTRSYLIPVGDLSLDERRGMRANTDDVLVASALELAIRTNPDDLILRDTLPFTDLALAAQEDWLIAGAGVVATELQYFSSALAVDRCIGFYGLSYESVPPSISRVRFTLGAASAQIRGSYQIEKLNSRLETAGYFSEAVVFTRQETARILVMPRLAFAANTQRLALDSRTVEPIGAVVSAPSA